MTVRNVLVLAALHFALAAAILFAALTAGHAAPVAWRIEVEACRAAACRTLPVSAARWSARFACQLRAQRIGEFGDITGLLPAGSVARARCRSVHGLPSA